MKETNRKTSPLAALLGEYPVDTTSRICNDVDCGNAALQNSGYCVSHIDKQPLDVPGLGEDAEAKAILNAQKLCTRCKRRPFVYGNEKDSMCEICATNAKARAMLNPKRLKPEIVGGHPHCVHCKTRRVDPDYGISEVCYECTGRLWKEDERAKSKPKHALNAKQKKIMEDKRRKDSANEETYDGPCRGGCGKAVQGEYQCYDCRSKKQRENLALAPGEVELYRGAVGKVEDKIIRQVVVVNAADGDIEDVEWIWLNKIPLGCATWAVGQPGNAKSLMTIDIASAVTTGRDFPDGSKNMLPASEVLMYCGEDSISKVVRPRLLAAGADLTKIGFLDRKSFREVAGDNDPTKRPLDLSQDCDTLLELVKQNPNIKLLVVDPITGVFGDANINKNEEANPVFEKLIDFCEASGIAFLGVLHVPKRTTNSAIEKIAGGTAVAGSAKSAFMLSRDPDSDDKHDHLLTMVKWNYADNADGLKYKTVSATAEWKGKTVKTAKIGWGEVIPEIADDVLLAQNSKKEAKDRQAGKCEAFLLTYLGSEPRRSFEVYEEAKKQGYGTSTVKRALENINGQHIDGRRVGKGNGWWMALQGVSFPAPKEEKLMALAADEGL
jgi:putative DNA primase/helicase